MPGWLKIGIVLFIVYVFFKGQWQEVYPQKHEDAKEKISSSLLLSEKVGQQIASAQSFRLEDDFCGKKASGDSGFGLRVFETVSGTGDAATCGDEVEIHYDVWDAAGSKVFSTRAGGDAAKPERFALGAGSYPLALERAVLGMRPGGSRTVVVPKDFMQVLAADAPEAEDSGSARQAMVIDIQMVDIRHKAEAAAESSAAPQPAMGETTPEGATQPTEQPKE